MMSPHDHQGTDGLTVGGGQDIDQHFPTNANYVYVDAT